MEIVHGLDLEGCKQRLPSLKFGWLETQPIRIGEEDMVSPLKGKLSANQTSFRPALTACASDFSARAQFPYASARLKGSCLLRSFHAHSFNGGSTRINPFLILNMPDAPSHWPPIAPQGRRDARAKGSARGMSQRVSHGQQNAHRCLSSGRNPGGGAAR
ncbi:hypothetical protein [Methyloferula stellata]|uniref:hypothetical protein n=1 Tax=Methyloferula stellata TaxID=876270 RepID=UPI0012693732|nr:hypothetical protein [Methyloferula stellata]